MSLALTSIYALKSSANYTHPLRANDVIPNLFGDLIENSGDAPVTPCVYLNTTTYTHAISGLPILTEANGNTFRFWDENTDEITSGFTVTPSIDYEGQGAIAIVTFDADHGEVSCQCKGAINASGDLITNPVTLFETIVGGAAALHRTSFSRASLLAEELGYIAAGAITSEHKYETWLTNLATSFLMDYYPGSDDEIHIRLDSKDMTGIQPAFELLQRETTRVEACTWAENLLNRVPAYYAPTYAKRDRRFREGINADYLAYDDGISTQNADSIRRYGIQDTIDGVKGYQFDWCRNTVSITAIQNRLIERFAHPQWCLEWQEYSKQAMYAEEGDIGIYSWEDRIDAYGAAVLDRYCQVLKKTIPLIGRGVSFSLRDLGMRYERTVKLWNGTDMTLGASDAYW